MYPMTIYFYRVRDPYGALSNHSPHGFVLDGRYWPTIEHYYQAQKFVGTPYAEEIRLATKPMDAKRLGNSPDWPLRPDWEAVKEEVIFRATLAKYETHADVQAILLATGDEELVENSPTDYDWGCGADGSGQNRYGQVLMAVRTQLRRQAQAASDITEYQPKWFDDVPSSTQSQTGAATKFAGLSVERKDRQP